MELGQANDDALTSNLHVSLGESEQPMLTENTPVSRPPTNEALHVQVPPVPARRSFKSRSPSPTSETSSSSSSVTPTPVPTPRTKLAPPTAVPRTRLPQQNTGTLPGSSSRDESSPTHMSLGKCASLPVQSLDENRKPPSPKPRHRPSPVPRTPLSQPSSVDSVTSSSPPKTATSYQYLEDVNTKAYSTGSQLPGSSHAVTHTTHLDPPMLTAQVDVQNTRQAPPPPVRTSSRRKNHSELGRETVSKTAESDGTATQASPTHHPAKESPEQDQHVLPTIPSSCPYPAVSVDGSSAGHPPELPPKDISLSDLPDQVMPRISSLDVLLSTDISAKGLQSPTASDKSATVIEEVPPDTFVSSEKEFIPPNVESTPVDIFTPLPSLPLIEEAISSLPVEAAIAQMPQDGLLEDVPGGCAPPPPPRAAIHSIPDFIAPFPPPADDSEDEDPLLSAATTSLILPPSSRSVLDPGSPSLEERSQPPALQAVGVPPLVSSLSNDGELCKDSDDEPMLPSPELRQVPPLPPKDVPNIPPPPPPPITDEDFPSGYSSDSGSSTVEGQKVVIMSSFSRQSTRGIIPLTPKQSPLSDEVDESVSTPLSPVSSGCSDSEKGLVTIVQQSSMQHDDIIDMDVPFTSTSDSDGTHARRSTLTRQPDPIEDNDDILQTPVPPPTNATYESIPPLRSPQTSPKHELQPASNVYATVKDVTAPDPASSTRGTPQVLCSIDEEPDFPRTCMSSTHSGISSVYSTIGDISAAMPAAANHTKLLSDRTEGSSSFNLHIEHPNSTEEHSADRNVSVQPRAGKQLGYSHTVRNSPKTGNNRPLVRSSISESALERQFSITPSASRVSASRLDEVPRTKEGFLHKRGGKKNEKGWQKRWVVFDGEDLKYFKNKGVKEIEARNTVKISEMIDIKKVKDHELPEQYHRFDLVVINRVFQFYSDSEEQCQMWVNVLHAAISRYSPSEEPACKEGGSMHDPDMQGILLKQGHGRLATGFKSRYVALKGARFAYYDSKEDYINSKPIHVLEMKLASVKHDMTPGRPRFTITMPNNRTYVFQASNDTEKTEWIEKLNNAILMGLNMAPEEKPGKRVKAEEILLRIQENPSNKACADCGQSDPSWGVVNRGIMVCIECSGVHRSMGVHISKVRSVELDQNIWTDSLINLMVAIGNGSANKFWEKHFQGEPIPVNSPREIRENFIRSKYESKCWISRSSGNTQEVLNKALCVAVATDDIMRTTELLVCGAELSYVHPEPSGSANTPLAIAKAHKQLLQIELLEQNGALIAYSPTSTRSPNALPVFKRGYLHKTGSDRQSWKRRFCQVDSFKGMEYYKSETDSDLLGRIRLEEMLGVSQSEDEALPRDTKNTKCCFEVITPSRAYLFCADTEQEMHSWIDAIRKIIPDDAADRLGYDKIGYLATKIPHKTGLKKRWFSLKGRKLTYFKRDHEEMGSVDLSKMLDLKGPEQGGYESKCSFQIVLQDSTFHLRADTPVEADSWVQILRHTQISRKPLSDQQVTNNGIPILVHKCLQFVETYGLEVEGLYRKSGERAKIRQLIMAFNQDPRSVVLDPEAYLVHDVTGTLKHFFQSLPDPLFTHHLYSAFLSAGLISDHETKMCQLQSLIDKLPSVNRDTLQRMINHLLKVIANEAKNKMTQSNLISLFGPTLMTVEGDPVSFADSQSQYNCIDLLLTYYKWLFQVDEDEDKKEEAMQTAMQKIKEAQLLHKTATMNSGMDFLISVLIKSRDGARCGMKVNALTKSSDVVEFVTTCNELTPSNYALFLVVGDSESERPLHSNEKVLGVQTGLKTDSFFCIKPNNFADTLQLQPRYTGRSTNLHVREKRKWKKYPCCVKEKHFIQYRDVKCQNEVFRVHVSEVDLFIGIEQQKIDVKNPLPTRYPFCLRTRLEDSSRYLCADTTEDMLTIAAGFIESKYPSGGIQSPITPTKSAPAQLPPQTEGRCRGISFLHGPSAPTNIPDREYTNYKFPGKGSKAQPSGLADQRLVKELKRSVSPPSIPHNSSS